MAIKQTQEGHCTSYCTYCPHCNKPVRIEEKTLFHMVQDFNYKYGIELNFKPDWIVWELERLGFDHLKEELQEYAQALTLEGKLDALVDLVYVAMGLAAKYGFDFNEAFRRVHESNMTKTRAENPEQSKRGSSFDIIKGPDFKPANIKDLVE